MPKDNDHFYDKDKRRYLAFLYGEPVAELIDQAGFALKEYGINPPGTVEICDRVSCKVARIMVQLPNGNMQWQYVEAKPSGDIGVPDRDGPKCSSNGGTHAFAKMHVRRPF